MTMKHLLLTTIAAAVLVGNAFADPIHDAAKSGDFDVVQAELEKGVDVKAKDEFGRTPLYLAAENGRKQIVELLISKGADVNARDAGFTPLHRAAYQGRKETAETLIAKGADVNAKDANGWTSLHTAVFYGQKEVTQLLIAEGADVNAKSIYGHTPLHNVARYGHKKIAELLLAESADVNAKDGGGLSTLHLAAEYGQKEITELLIANGASVNAKSKGGHMRVPMTPLDKAKGEEPLESAETKAKKKEIADLLRERGGKLWQELWALMPRLSFTGSPFGFTFNTIEGKTYWVEAGMDLKKWNKLKEIKGTGDEVKFVDVRRIYFPQHFYRVKVVD